MNPNSVLFATYAIAGMIRDSCAKNDLDSIKFLIEVLGTVIEENSDIGTALEHFAPDSQDMPDFMSEGFAILIRYGLYKKEVTN